MHTATMIYTQSDLWGRDTTHSSLRGHNMGRVWVLLKHTASALLSTFYLCCGKL